MEAFEKYLAGTPVRSTSVDAEIMRQTWRAALEYALQEWHADQYEFEGAIRRELREKRMKEFEKELEDK